MIRWFHRLIGDFCFRCKQIDDSRAQEFRPDLAFINPISTLTLEECVKRVAWCTDDPVIYSNEPTKDRQAILHLGYLAAIGNKLVEVRKQGPEALQAWIDTLKEIDELKLSSY